MKKKILFFVRDGQPTDVHKKTADAIASTHDALVPFRNSSFAGQDTVEPCDGVAGAVPQIYADAFPRVSVKSPYAFGPKPGATVDTPEAPENPEGGKTKPTEGGTPLATVPDLPKDKEGLRKWLDDRDVKYHPNQGVPALTKLAVEAVAAAEAKAKEEADKTAGQ